MHPFLDVKKLTDDEILTRLGKAYQYMNVQAALGHTPTVISIQEVIQSLEDERQSRQFSIRDEEFKKKYPTANNSIDIGKLEE